MVVSNPAANHSFLPLTPHLSSTILPILSAPFPIDGDDDYNLVLALFDPAGLGPVLLEQGKHIDSGDFAHPAVHNAIKAQGRFTLDDLTAVACRNQHLSTGPLYTPKQALALALTVDKVGEPNYCGARIPVKSHLNTEVLQFLLADYSDPWPLRGAVFGWPLDRDRSVPLSNTVWDNHNSCHRNIDQVNDFITAEVNHGAIFPLGLAPANLSPPVSTIPLLCVPKLPDLTKVRVCGDMSFPPFASVNCGIPETSYCGEDYRVRLPTIWDYIAQLRYIGLDDVVIGKLDWARGFRQIPIDPRDWLLQMFSLPHIGLLMDTRAIFGGRTSGTFMQRFHQSLAYASMQFCVNIDEAELCKSVDKSKASYRSYCPYVDDGLVAMHRACASSYWSNLQSVYEATNVKLSLTPGHVSPPGRTLRALGFDVDCDAGTLSLPEPKLQEMLQFVDKFLIQESVTILEIKQLLGRICRCCMVIREGRRFIGRLLLLLKGPHLPPQARVSLPDGARADLRWWQTYGPRLNSSTLIQPPLLPLTSAFCVDGCGGQIDSGVSPSVGGLCYLTRTFFSQTVPAVYFYEPIHIIEAIVLLAACRVWVPMLPTNHIIPIASDNMAVVLAVQHGRAKDLKLQAMARLLWGLFASYSVQSRVLYVPSKDNPSDGLSRLLQDDIDKLLDMGWTRFHVSDDLFSLIEP